MRFNHFILTLIAIVMTLGFASTTRADVKLPALIGDNMVVQQGVRARVWGWAAPGEPVTVSMAGQSVKAKADAQGKWEVRIGPFKAGGPHEMTIAGKNTVVLRNVLVGEVWVGSGQSNMEWPLQNVIRGGDEVARASHPEIHLFTVAKATALEPRDDVQGRWVVCTPENAATFSAVAYFFGRELNEKLKVPVGLIHTSWGGTPAEAWTSRAALAATAELRPMAEALERASLNLPEARRAYEAAQAKWEQEHFLQDTGNRGLDLGYARADFSEEGWQSMRLPQFWETAGLLIDGAVWFRKTVEVPAAWAGRDLTLSLGPVDDFDVTYFNGAKVGATGSETPNFYMVPRKYTVPGSLVKAGRNVIAVRAFDHYGQGGFGGGPSDMTLSLAGASPISIAGDWLYKVEMSVEPIKVDFATQPIAPPGVGNPNTATVLYNAMLAPLTPYAIRGAIWYQGEANVGRARQYRTLFPAMIRNWREAWGGGSFPFLFVQLANFQARQSEPGESAWAELREAQTMTLNEPATGMAVIIDIGEAGDIHPKNKQDVGHRLAVWALAKTYGQSVEYSGPLFDSFAVEGNKVRVRFTHADGLRTGDGGPVKGFAVAGADGKFVWADAMIDGKDVVVWNDSVTTPVAVRYAWADNPATNLYNGAGLPAAPFRTDSKK
ncbi:MAG TPA: sialate O-acetylesterase [Blastocatellia bacterium]|nr:sialate O-acetylesterase [Blastocatellia bacterium]